MSQKFFASLAAAVLCTLSFSGVASANLIGVLTHEQPTGIIGPNDSFGDLMRFTLGVGSDPLVTDNSAQIISNTFVNGDSVTGGTLTTTAYGLNPNGFFNLSFGPGGNFGLFFPQFYNLNLVNPGDSFTFVGSYWLPNGVTPPGTYTQTFLSELNVWDTDFNIPNDPNSGNVLRNIAKTEDYLSRTVVDQTVPEPTSMLLLGSALGLLGVRRRFVR